MSCSWLVHMCLRHSPPHTLGPVPGAIRRNSQPRGKGGGQPAGDGYSRGAIALHRTATSRRGLGQPPSMDTTQPPSRFFNEEITLKHTHEERYAAKCEAEIEDHWNRDSKERGAEAPRTMGAGDGRCSCMRCCMRGPQGMPSTFAKAIPVNCRGPRNGKKTVRCFVAAGGGRRCTQYVQRSGSSHSSATLKGSGTLAHGNTQQTLHRKSSSGGCPSRYAQRPWRPWRV